MRQALEEPLTVHAGMEGLKRMWKGCSSSRHTSQPVVCKASQRLHKVHLSLHIATGSALPNVRTRRIFVNASFLVMRLGRMKSGCLHQ
mmetsp:Transcript_45907/g.94837  ORF Transcript_45907/g.94837 Transcript_45907/m.94837 type:complete len:88 (-) Transcript_45907:404-667(-)